MTAKTEGVLLLVVAGVVLGIVGVWMFLPARPASNGGALVSNVVAAETVYAASPTTQPEESRLVLPGSATTQQAAGTDPDFNVGVPLVHTSSPAASNLLKQAQASQSRGDLLAARTQFNQALRQGLAGAEAETAKSALKDISHKTLFNLTVLPGDPYTKLISVQAGDNLKKIGAEYKVPSDLLAKINNISDPKFLRAGQSLKVIQGPFNVIVTKGTFELVVYLGPNYETFVGSYPVALGADDSTPTGLWKVMDRVANPKFWGARNLPPMESDDPKNPLGEHWIALGGLKGESVGMTGYGIHGTIEPQTIGQRVSLGCIRMKNEDVAEVFRLMYPNLSMVLVRP